METDSTGRFSNRVDDYAKYRPGYPAGIISYLQQDFGLAPGQVVADIGSGTGISSALFLKAGNTVFAVEPNPEMRERSEVLLGEDTNFTAVDGTAEQTTLGGHSMDVLVAGQAFHWFRVHESRAEFSRILKQKNLVVLIWNERLTDADFERDYDQLIIRHGNDYRQVDHRQISTENIEAFFNPQPCTLKIFPNVQVFDFEGLKGRLLSSSYMPSLHDPGYKAMISDLQELYNRYQVNDRIHIRYATKVYTGRL